MKMKTFMDFNVQRVCPSCGKILKLEHNFCKYCGVDLSGVDAMGRSHDPISINLANTAVTDPDPGIRKEALDTLGDFKDSKILGILTLVLLNDPDENVRCEAADELGDLHHPYSLSALSLALKDRSAIVRKEAIEGLKKIKEKNKEKKVEKQAKDDKDRAEGKPKEKKDKEKKDKEKKDKEKKAPFTL
jgi:HEAT repeat protein